ncbi:NAD(+) diphosphatase [Microbacterium horticulturae]|uniref:NAD(+) diphosphatase n=1 Tax=Microbacterium horticulturae TaxID=3028316 RepID=A0ABY8BUJ9_9MICO|nr:NAD(+) diphosphatase [Microbacterium sp. KACC 23027]WEG07497.1 NAD(+) diphosphatase [Microbacterium sp. KACC 23027]
MNAQHRAATPAEKAVRFDRSAAERARPELLDELRGDAATRVLVVRGDAVEVVDEAGARLRWARAGEAPPDAEWAFLGRAADGAPVLLARTGGRDLPPGDWMSLRTVGGDLDAVDGDLLSTAVSLGRWLRDSAFCPRCGHACTLENAGWSRRCPECGVEHFPRTDPAVIVAVTSDAAPQRLLLGSNALWGPNRYSCFAGFVEAGESAEAAVERELFEEAGIHVRDVQYRRSQPWPYPRSLMLGFRARAVDDAEARADGDEIAALRWFTRAEIGEALVRGDGATRSDATSRDDELLLPRRASIAHRLIADWYAETA